MLTQHRNNNCQVIIDLFTPRTPTTLQTHTAHKTAIHSTRHKTTYHHTTTPRTCTTTPPLILRIMAHTTQHKHITPQHIPPTPHTYPSFPPMWRRRLRNGSHFQRKATCAQITQSSLKGSLCASFFVPRLVVFQHLLANALRVGGVVGGPRPRYIALCCRRRRPW